MSKNLRILCRSLITFEEVVIVDRCEESGEDIGVTGRCRVEGMIFAYGREGGKYSVSG